jgi:hypothetical protein
MVAAAIRTRASRSMAVTSIFAQPSAEAVSAQFDRIIREIKRRTDVEDLLAFSALPLRALAQDLEAPIRWSGCTWGNCGSRVSSRRVPQRRRRRTPRHRGDLEQHTSGPVAERRYLSGSPTPGHTGGAGDHVQG